MLKYSGLNTGSVARKMYGRAIRSGAAHIKEREVSFATGVASKISSGWRFDGRKDGREKRRKGRDPAEFALTHKYISRSSLFGETPSQCLHLRRTFVPQGN